MYFTFLQKLGCLKLTYHQNTELKIISSKKELTLKSSSEKERSKYLFGYNTQEKTDEIKGSGNHYTAKFWEYDPRVVTRWNRDPITYPWQSPYAINNNNPIVFTDPLGLFGTRKEARQYKKSNGLKGRVQYDKNDGIFAINNKKAGTSLFRDASLENVPNLIGRQDDGVISAVLVTAKRPSSNSPSLSNYNDGLKEFGKRGGNLTKTNAPLKSTGKIKYYDNNWGGNQYVKTSKVFSTKLTKGIAKKAPVIGHLLNAKEVYDGIQKDGGIHNMGANTAKELAGVAGGAGGAWAGAAGGAAIGSLIFPGVGTVIGGVIGGVLGSWGGEAAAEAIVEEIND